MNNSLFLLFLFSSTLLFSFSLANHIYDVVHYGAVGNGLVDDTQAFKKAWEATCKSSSSSPTMRIPSGKTFLLSPSTFEGPCRSDKVHVLIEGNIIAPTNINHWWCGNSICEEWIKFSDIDGLYIYGTGKIDGQGSNWWDNHICGHNGCKRRPEEFKISHSSNVHISNVKFVNSPNKHLVIFMSKRVNISNVQINAPYNSPNTDGIYIARSSNVFVEKSHIGTGDDCISIGPDTSHINIEKIHCGPGHGISIGSLGKNEKRETVEHVYVNNVELRGTTNGVRIKTWQGGKGYVRDVLFQHIKCVNTKNPIVIDQYYCDPHAHLSCKNHTSAVKISNIRYNHVYGTSAKEDTITLACSETVPCTDITLNDVNLHFTSKHDKHTSSHCFNAHGKSHERVFPKVPCLSHH